MHNYHIKVFNLKSNKVIKEKIVYIYKKNMFLKFKTSYKIK